MKFSDLEISTLQNAAENDSYFICNTVNSSEDGPISKSLIHVSNFANKDEVAAVVDQNAKLVEIVTSLVAKVQQAEKEIEQLKTSSCQKFNNDEIDIKLNDLMKRLDENLIEA